MQPCKCHAIRYAAVRIFLENNVVTLKVTATCQLTHYLAKNTICVSRHPQTCYSVYTSMLRVLPVGTPLHTLVSQFFKTNSLKQHSS